MKFPKQSEVASDLRNISKRFEGNPPTAYDDGLLDVRLQVYPDGRWAVRFGSSDYDQDHHGYWGASSVPGSGKRFDAVAVAKDLIEQAKEQYADDE